MTPEYIAGLLIKLRQSHTTSGDGVPSTTLLQNPEGPAAASLIERLMSENADLRAANPMMDEFLSAQGTPHDPR